MTRGTHRGLVGKLKVADHLEDLVVDGSGSLKEWQRKVRNGPVSIRILTSVSGVEGAIEVQFPQKAGNSFNLLKPTGHVMHQHFNIQQL